MRKSKALAAVTALLALVTMFLSAQSGYADDLDDLIDETPSPTATSSGKPIDEFIKENKEEEPSETPTGTEDLPPAKSPDIQFEKPENKHDDPATDFMKNYKPVTKEDMDAAQAALGPVLAIISPIISGGIILMTGALFLVTMLDLIYITIPFTRKALYTPGTSGTGSAMAGAGMGMGMGMGGSPQAQSGSGFFGRIARSQWVSDEAVSAVALRGGEAPAQGNQMGGMFGPAMTPAQTENVSTGTVIAKYLKSRIIVMVLLGLSITLLFSSIFLNFGMDVGGMIITKLMEWFN